MPANPTIVTFAGVGPPWSLANLDTNFANCATLLASANNYSNYLTDTGAANAYVVTFAAGVAATLTAGLEVVVKAANANTGSSTLNVNNTGVKNLVNPDGSTLSPNQISVGLIFRATFDGTNYQFQTITSAQNVQNFNWTFNGDFEIWGSGIAAAPTGWTLAGAGASVAKNTTAGQFQYSLASAALTRSGTDCQLQQDIDLIPGFGPVSAWQGKTVTFGCWVRATVNGRAVLIINDGVSQTSSSAHPGNSVLSFLTVTRTIDPAATRLRIICQVQTGDTTAQYDGAILVLGSWVSNFIPSGWRGRKAVLSFSTAQSATIAAGTTAFINGAGADTTEANVYMTLPFKCVARNLRCSSTMGPTAGQTFIYTLRNTGGGTDTALTTTIADTNIGNSDTTHEVVYNVAQFSVLGFLSLKLVTSAGAAATHHFGSIELEEIP